MTAENGNYVVRSTPSRSKRHTVADGGTLAMQGKNANVTMKAKQEHHSPGKKAINLGSGLNAIICNN